jgi:hypothetical protein
MENAVRIAWIAFCGVFLFVNPVLIACVWFMRLNEIPVSPQWRWVMSWISISLATVAFGAWIGTATNVPQKTIELTIEQLRYGVNTGLAFSSTAVAAALFANGRGQSLTAASALIPTLVYPISWVASATLRDGVLDQDFKFFKLFSPAGRSIDAFWESHYIDPASITKSSLDLCHAHPQLRCELSHLSR